jgi:hypothetical protein
VLWELIFWEFVFEVTPLAGIFAVVRRPLTDFSLRTSWGLGLVIGWEDLVVKGVFVVACSCSFMRDGWMEVIFPAGTLVDLADLADAAPGCACVF